MQIFIVGSLLDQQRLRRDQRSHHLGAAGRQQPLHRSTRDSHERAGRLLLQALEVAQPQRLELAQLETHGLELRERDAARLEDAVTQVTAAVTALAGARHQ
jgi:hypothetical protein